MMGMKKGTTGNCSPKGSTPPVVASSIPVNIFFTLKKLPLRLAKGCPKGGVVVTAYRLLVTVYRFPRLCYTSLFMKNFEQLYAELLRKAQERDPNSGTVRELDKGVHFIGKKIIEEAGESWMACEHEGKERAAEEISQLFYHLQVMMIAKGITLEDIYKYL